MTADDVAKIFGIGPFAMRGSEEVVRRAEAPDTETTELVVRQMPHPNIGTHRTRPVCL
jgi:hypothetical protein